MDFPVARRGSIKLARELLSLDQRSGDRVVAGVGLGDTSEFIRTGGCRPRSRRREALEDGVPLLDRLLHEVGVTTPESGIDEPLSLGPRPRNGRVPIWLGTVHDRPMGPRRAAMMPITEIIPFRAPWDLRRLLGAKELKHVVDTTIALGGSFADVATIGRRRNPEFSALDRTSESWRRNKRGP